MPCIDLQIKRAALVAAVLLTACSTPPPPEPIRPATPGSVARPAAALHSAGAVRSMNEMRLQAARRLVAANPNSTYTGTVPDMLLAVPVLEVELNSDGSVRHIEVLRYPRQAKDTVQLAIDAIHRAAPFGDVSRASKPWKFTETFLFNEDRRFKPRTLDE